MPHGLSVRHLTYLYALIIFN